VAYTTDPWKCWWNFNANEYLVCPHSADWDVDDGGGSHDDSTLIIGFEGTRTNAGTEYLTSKSRGTTDANDGDWRFWISRNGLEQVTYTHRVGGGHNWKGVAVNDYLPNVKTVASGQRESNTKFVHVFVDDEDGTDLGNNLYTSSGDNWHGTDDIWIGAHRNSVGTPQYQYTGRIYFFYWLKGLRVLDGWNEYILSGEDRPGTGTPYPWDYYDTETYPQCLITFEKSVGGTYIPELQSGPNAPYTFTVYGSPTKDCDVVEVETESVLGHEFAVSGTTSQMLGHQFTVPSRRKLLRDLSKITRKELGRRIY
jgi:hypothetical protein